MNRTGSLLTVSAATAVLSLVPVPASADTENCVSMGEYDQLEILMSPQSVSELFDISGVFLGQGSEDTYRKGYRSCWNPDERRVVVWYDDNTSLSVRWAIRDV